MLQARAVFLCAGRRCQVIGIPTERGALEEHSRPSSGISPLSSTMAGVAPRRRGGPVDRRQRSSFSLLAIPPVALVASLHCLTIATRGSGAKWPRRRSSEKVNTCGSMGPRGEGISRASSVLMQEVRTASTAWKAAPDALSPWLNPSCVRKGVGNPLWCHWPDPMAAVVLLAPR